MMKTLCFFPAVFLAALSGCTDRYALDNRGPDEYSVMANPPLSLPPDFMLRAPEPEKHARKNAAEAVLTHRETQEAVIPETQETALSDGERALLGETPDSGNDAVREQLKDDEAALNDDSLYLERKIREWKEENGESLDAEKEAGKLRERGIGTTGGDKTAESVR